MAELRARPSIDERIPWASKNAMIFVPSSERYVHAGRAAEGPHMRPRDTVSVVIPSYNMDWCVTRAITSCQIQSLSVDEIIIVDDRSMDTTGAVVRNLMDADPRIKYWRL